MEQPKSKFEENCIIACGSRCIAAIRISGIQFAIVKVFYQPFIVLHT